MWTVLIIILVIAFLYYSGRGSKQVQRTVSPQKPTFYKKLSKEQFDDLIAEYKARLDLPDNDDKQLEKLANDFELKFYLRTQLYDFFSFLEEKLSEAKNLGEGNGWWSSKLIGFKNIHINEAKYKDFSLTVTLDGIEIQFSSQRKNHIDEFETSFSPYDPSYYDFDRAILIKTSGVVYQTIGWDYRVDYRPPKIPSSIMVKSFKPSKWLLTIHNFLLDFEQEKPEIESNLERLKSEHALKRAKERFAV